jgi:nitrogen regulatory protein PII
MKRITAVLRESEAMAVRKAVCVAGGDRVVITPLAYRMCGVDMMDIYSEKMAAGFNKYVQLDVMADNRLYGNIVSIIRRVAQTGSIVLAPGQGGHAHARCLK